MRDAHYRENNDMYAFVAAMLKPPATIQMHGLIFDHLPFYVDISKNFIQKLSHNQAAELEAMKTKIKKNVIKNLLKELKAQREKEDENQPAFQFMADSIIKRAVGYERPYAMPEKKESEITKNTRATNSRLFDKL